MRQIVVHVEKWLKKEPRTSYDCLRYLGGYPWLQKLPRNTVQAMGINDKLHHRLFYWVHTGPSGKLRSLTSTRLIGRTASQYFKGDQ